MALQDFIPGPLGQQGNFFQMDPMSGSMMEEAVKQNQQAAMQQQAQAQAQEQQTLLDMARAKAIEQDPTLNYVQRRIVDGLLDAKKLYHAASNVGDTQSMTYAENLADMRRREAEGIGFDASQYGKNVTLEDAIRNQNKNDTRALSNMFYDTMDSGNYFNQEYRNLLRAGMSEDGAMEEARIRASAYQADRINRLRDAFSMYGMDERGAINSNGMRLISMLADESKDQASLYGNMNPTPVQNWNFENSMLLSDKGQQQALQKMAAQHQYRQQEAEEAQKRARQDAQWKADFSDERARRAMVERYNTAIALGNSEEESRYYALTGKMPSGNSGGTGGKSSGSTKEAPEMTNAEKKIFNAIRNNESNIESLLSAGNDPEKIAEAENAIEAYRELYKKWNNAGVDYDTMRGVEARIKEYDDQLNVNKQGGINQATGGPSSGITGAEYIDEETFNELPEEVQQEIKQRYEALDEQTLSRFPESRREVIRKIRGY